MALDKLDHPKLQFSFLEISDIPLYNQDFDTNLPASVVRFKKEVSESDAVIIATPEYNRSIPGVLKNLIDWGTRPYGQNVWTGKPVMSIGTSPGAVGTAVAQSHLRSIMVSQGAVQFGLPEIYLVHKEGLIDSNFNITVDSTRKFLQDFINKFTTAVEKFKSA
jgi:chromate reductase